MHSKLHRHECGQWGVGIISSSTVPHTIHTIYTRLLNQDIVHAYTVCWSHGSYFPYTCPQKIYIKNDSMKCVTPSHRNLMKFIFPLRDFSTTSESSQRIPAQSIGGIKANEVDPTPQIRIQNSQFGLFSNGDQTTCSPSFLLGLAFFFLHDFIAVNIHYM